MGDADRKKQHFTTIPFKMMVMTALEQLPGREGTLNQIRDIIASTAAYKSELDWTVQKGRRASPMWHKGCDRALGSHPELFEPAGKRATKRGHLNLWKLRDVELTDKTGCPDTKKIAISTLSALSETNEANQDAIRAAGGIAVLVRLLQGSSSDEHFWSEWCKSAARKCSRNVWVLEDSSVTPFGQPRCGQGGFTRQYSSIEGSP
ncbi:hypothetical protein WJX72_007059 [[Myrmecia] bisecta]|uniref:Uncharacterized protein n=1 Tax=[Myrmecia] bisecta TaxID=41462 RepID=A0AAW1PKB8_9CHLO